MNLKKTATLLLFLMGAGILQAQLTGTDRELLELRERMSGFFTSEQQSLADSSYYNIHLHMKPKWTERTDGYWLYVEQAMASAAQRPYRQRMYQLFRQDDSTLVSKVYELNAPLRFAGAWKNTALLQQLTTDSLQARQGCAIYLHRDTNGRFSGSTPGNECLSSLRGAAYATSEVVIEKNQMISWDRGWSQSGQQVWGAVKGGYHFVKQNP